MAFPPAKNAAKPFPKKPAAEMEPDPSDPNEADETDEPAGPPKSLDDLRKMHDKLAAKKIKAKKGM